MKRFSLAFLLLLSACATHEPRWTPAEVAPPAWVPPVEAAAESSPAPEANEAPSPAVPLSVQEAVLLAFANNRGVDVSELDPAIAATAIDEARAQFDVNLAASLRAGRNTTEFENNTSSAFTTGLGTDVDRLVQSINTVIREVNSPIITSDVHDTTSRLVVQQQLPTGTRITATGDYSGTRSNLNPNTYDGAWNVELAQPLLQGAGTGVNFVALRKAKNNTAISEHAFRRDVLELVEQVEVTYWDLVLAKALLGINTFAVGLADEQLRLNQDLLAAGRGVEADVLSAEAERASRAANVIDAQAQIKDRNLLLIRLLNPQADSPWQISFEPETPAEAPVVAVDTEASVKLAMDYRPELAQARLDLSNADLDVRSAKNSLLPQLDLVASYGESNGANSTGGALNFLDDDDGSSYAIGLEFSTPIPRRAEKARYRRSLLSQTQRERLIADTEQGVETETRRAVVEVERQWAQITPAQEAVHARTRELETAQARYTTGRSTNLDVLIVQRDLIQAQVNEVSARIAYLQALSSLYAAEGTLLDRRGITLEIEEE
jgi:outer membrane protein